MIVALLTCLVFFVTLLSCVSDVRALRIPNTHVLFILGAFVPAFALSPESFGLWWHPFAAAAISPYSMAVAPCDCLKKNFILKKKIKTFNLRNKL